MIEARNFTFYVLVALLSFCVVFMSPRKALAIDTSVYVVPNSCICALDAAAKAERFEDAGEDEEAFHAWQDSIMKYGDCLDDHSLSALENAEYSIWRVGARDKVAEYMVKAGNTDEASSQVMRASSDLANACPYFDKFNLHFQTNVRVYAMFFVGLSNQLDLLVPDYVKQCKPL
jgi:hypothetical protein